MTLCLPFLMFQGRAQEAIDHYLETFPDAELLEIQHHPEGTEIFVPAEEAGDEAPEEQELSEQESPAEEDEPEELLTEEAEDELADDLSEELDEEALDATIQLPAVTAETHPEDLEDPAEGDDPAEAEEPAELPLLVATAQLRIGGQVLMIQDSLVKHQFSFTPSSSIAVVVDSASEFDQIVDRLAEGGEYLMEPGDYDFAQNFAWVTDRFGLSWQVNHPLGLPEQTSQAKAPEWG